MIARVLGLSINCVTETFLLSVGAVVIDIEIVQADPRLLATQIVLFAFFPFPITFDKL